MKIWNLKFTTVTSQCRHNCFVDMVSWPIAIKETGAVREAVVGPAVMGSTAKIICSEIKYIYTFFSEGWERGAAVDGSHTQQTVVKNRSEELGWKVSITLHPSEECRRGERQGWRGDEEEKKEALSLFLIYRLSWSPCLLITPSPPFYSPCSLCSDSREELSLSGWPSTSNAAFFPRTGIRRTSLHCLPFARTTHTHTHWRIRTHSLSSHCHRSMFFSLRCRKWIPCLVRYTAQACSRIRGPVCCWLSGKTAPIQTYSCRKVIKASRLQQLMETQQKVWRHFSSASITFTVAHTSATGMHLQTWKLQLLCKKMASLYRHHIKMCLFLSYLYQSCFGTCIFKWLIFTTDCKNVTFSQFDNIQV